MTHEKLLEKLADIAHNKDAHDARNDYLLALRAVVEMHRPNSFGQCDECVLLCWGCGEWGCETNCRCDCHPNYPCPTIQAIEKELK